MQFYRITKISKPNTGISPHTFYVEVEDEDALAEITGRHIDMHRATIFEIRSKKISQAAYIRATRPGE